MSIRPLSALLLGAGVLLVAGLTVPAAAPPRTAGLGLVLRTYHVADLVIPVETVRMPGQKAERCQTQELALIGLIQRMVHPESWSCNGGAGTIEYFPLTMSLVVHQTPCVHEGLNDLLNALRRMQDLEVAAEVRLVTVSDEGLANAGIPLKEGETLPGVLTFDDEQLRELMEAIQSDRSANVMQAPKMTMFNGQRVSVNVTDKQSFVTGVKIVPAGDSRAMMPKQQTLSTGIRLSLLPTVAADRRTVSVQFGMHLARLKSDRVPTFPIVVPITPKDRANGQPVVFTQFIQQPVCSTLSVEQTLKIPDGKTAVFGGWTQEQEARHEFITHYLGYLPCVGKPFRQMSYSTEKTRLLVLVTPHIIVREEEEERRKQPPADAQQPAEEEEEKTEVQYTNKRDIELSYRLDNVGPSKVRSVEVWYTRDGQSWARYPDEVKPTGNVPVTVKGEGRWGFTLVPRSGAGLSAGPPKPGEAPQTWVEVDLTPPEAMLYAPQIKGPASKGSIDFSWSASDAQFGPGPVSLSWATSPDGPWNLIEKGLPAKGEHTCPSDLFPGEVYLRMEAADRAGNVAVLFSREPIKTDTSIPVIRDVKLNVGK